MIGKSFFIELFISIANGKCMEVVSTKGENINICWSPDGNTIAVGNKVKVTNYLRN